MEIMDFTSEENSFTNSNKFSWADRVQDFYSNKPSVSESSESYNYENIASLNNDIIPISNTLLCNHSNTSSYESIKNKKNSLKQSSVGMFEICNGTQKLAIHKLLNKTASIIIDYSKQPKTIKTSTYTEFFEISMCGDWKILIFNAFEELKITDICIIGKKSLETLRSEFNELMNSKYIITNDCRKNNFSCHVCGELNCTTSNLKESLKQKWVRYNFIKH